MARAGCRRADGVRKETSRVSSEAHAQTGPIAPPSNPSPLRNATQRRPYVPFALPMLLRLLILRLVHSSSCDLDLRSRARESRRRIKRNPPSLRYRRAELPTGALRPTGVGERDRTANTTIRARMHPSSCPAWCCAVSCSARRRAEIDVSTRSGSGPACCGNAPIV
jgi:hypothetical protein